MKITVLHGSPKGDTSVTMQYIRYLKENLGDHDWKVLNIASSSHMLEKDKVKWDSVMRDISESDAILWAFPLYHMLVCSQYKRFIELIFENKAEENFKGKIAAILSTSIHFMDHTAHNYIHGISEDLGMKVFGSYSADMYDLLNDKERGRLMNFGKSFISSVERNAVFPRKFAEIQPVDFIYHPAKGLQDISTSSHKITVLGDIKNGGVNLFNMVMRFKESFCGEISIFDLNDINIKGGCLGCLKCGYNNICSYDGKDGFHDFFETAVTSSDLIVIAGKINDRYLSAKDKQFFDRSFYNTHKPFFAGKQIAYIISGPLSQISNLREILESYPDVMKGNLAGIVTDESFNSESIDRELHELGRQLIEFADRRFIRPQTFLGKGGMQIFSDNIWTRLRPVFIADHRYFKKNDIYDLPHKKIGTRIASRLMAALMNFSFIREAFRSRIKEGMIQPFQKVFIIKDNI